MCNSPRSAKATPRLFPLGLACLLLSSLAVLVPSGLAANKFWNGGTGNWNTSSNWDPAGVPVNGDELFFPSLGAGAFKITTNNIPNPARRFRSVNFTDGGYTVRGNPIVVSNGVASISGVGINNLSVNVTLAGSQTFANSSPNFTIAGNVDLAGFNLTLDASDGGEFFVLSGAISGTGNLTKIGAGFLNLSGSAANTYVGSLAINTGELRLDKDDGIAAVTGDLTVAAGATVRWFKDNNVADAGDVTVGDGGTLNLNNHDETLGPLDLTGTAITTGTGTLTMNGDLTNRASAVSTTINGNLHLGSLTRTLGVATGGAVEELVIPATITGGSRVVGFPVGILIHAGIVKEGNGRLVLSGANTYGGGFSANGGFTTAQSDGAFGFVPLLGVGGGVTINPGGEITLVSADIAGHRLTVNRPEPSAALSASGASSWSGPVTLNTNATFTCGGTLALSNSISGVGGLRLFGGTFRFAGTNANTYTGDTDLRDGTLQLAQISSGDSIPNGSLFIGDGDGTDTVLLLENNQIGTAVDIRISDSGVLNLNSFNDFTGDLTIEGGTVVTGAGTITPDNITVVATNIVSLISGILNLNGTRTWTIQDGLQNPDLVVSAQIIGSGSLIKNGDGQLRLDAANTYSGQTTVNAGEVILRNATALGGTSAGTTLNGASLLTLQNNTRVGLEGLTNNGSGIVNLGTVLSTGGSNSWAGPIVLNAATIINTGNAADTLSLPGAISGPASLTKINPGTLFLDGIAENTFGGDMFAREGLLILGKTVGEAIPHDLIIGVTGTIFDPGTAATARQTASTLIIGSVTVNAGSLYDLNGFSEVIRDLTLNGGGDVQTGAGRLDLFGNVDVNGGGSLFGGTTSTINGNLDVGTGTRTFTVAETGGLFGDGNELAINARVSGSAAIIKTGAGDMALTASNTFTGSVTVNAGELNISDNNALGTLAGGTSVTGEGLLGLSDNITVPGESLTLNSTGQGADGALQNTGGTNTWTGAVSLTQTAVINVATNSGLTLGGVISGSGGVTKTGPGQLDYAGTFANTYLGVTTVNEGVLNLRKTTSDAAIPADLVIGDGVGGALSDVVRLTSGFQQLNTFCDITMTDSALLDLDGTRESFSTLAGSGRVDLGGDGEMILNGNGSTEYSGLIVGAGVPPFALIKRGTGTFTLSGNNTYTGTNIVEQGTVLVNGSQPQSPFVVLANATLGGSGRVGILNAKNLGNVSPGSSPGALSSGNTILEAGSNFRVELNGPDAGTGYDRLNVSGAVSLNGAQFLPTNIPGYAPADGDELIVVSNDGADAVIGTFAGRVEGSLVTFGGLDFRLSYVGGSGNDVTLTVTNVGLRFAAARVELGNGNGVIDPNECDHLFVALENRTGAAISGISTRLDSLTPGVAVTQPDSAYPNIPALGFRTNATPFQIRVSPDFSCGQNILLSLVVTATGEGTFALPFTLPSGSISVTRNFGSTNVPKAVISLQTTNSLIEVPNSFRVAKVRVSLHITHPSAGDLRLALRAPSGRTILLSTNHGGAGNNYGVACNNRAIFDDDAPNRIATGTAPFAGEFTPDEPLAGFVGEFAGGTWRLLVEDTVAGDDGALQCWLLTLSEAGCTDGGGECESCLTVAGSLTPASFTLPERIFRTGEPSGCGNIKPCPGGTTVPSVPPYRYNTHAFTNTGPDACVTVVLNVPCASATNALLSAAYLDRFLPPDLCANYLGDSGLEAANGSRGYSFRVPTGARFEVMVHELNPSETNQGCGNYTLQLYGLPCPPPVLDIAKTATPNRVRLSWSTAYPGFDLRGRTTLQNIPPQTFSVGDFGLPEPLNVIDGRYVLTNTVPGSTRFYELIK